MRKVFLILVAGSLWGCESQVVTELKQTRINEYPTYTIEQGFENRSVCGDVKWSVQEDKRSRTIIIYECHMAGVQEFEDRYLKTAIERLQSVNEAMTPAGASLENLEKEIARRGMIERVGANESDSETLIRLKARHEEYTITRKEAVKKAIARLQKESESNIPYYVETFRWIKVGDQFHLDSGGAKIRSFALGELEFDYPLKIALDHVYADVDSYEQYIQLVGIKAKIDQEISTLRSIVDSPMARHFRE